MFMLETFQNPSMMHAAVVHLPIALSMLGVPFVILAVLFGRTPLLRALAVAVYVLMAGSAYYAETTGKAAMGVVPNTLSQAIWDAIEHHEVMAERIKVAGVAMTLLLLVSFLPQPRVRLATGLLAVLGSLLTGYLVSAAAHEGGVLVYKYGVGTPHVKAIAPVPPAPAPAPAVVPEPLDPAPVDAPAAPTEPLSADPVDVPVDRPPAPVEAEANTATLSVAASSEDPEWVPIRPIDLAAAKTLVFSRDIWPIFDSQCLDCHTPPHPDGDYDMSTRERMLLPGAKGGPGVVPGDPDASSVVQYIRGVLKPRMPHKSDPLTEDDLHLIRQWIAAGAEVDEMP